MKTIMLSGLIVVVAAVVAADRAGELVDLAHTNVMNCGQEFELPADTIAKLHDPKLIEAMHVDNNVKCFMKCLLDRSPITDTNGNLDMENYVAVMQSHGKDPNIVRNRFKECSPLYTNVADCSPLWAMALCFNGLKY